MLRISSLILFAALAALALFPRGATAGQSGLAFVLNSGAASLSLIDVATEREIRRIPLAREPHHMALSPDHTGLLVGDTVANTLYVFNPQTGALMRQLTVADPYQLQFSPDKKWFVVNGLARNQVDIYDAASMHLLHRVHLAAMPSHINFRPDSAVVFISLQQTNRVAAIATASGAVLWNVEVGSTPAGVLWHDGKLLVGLMGADEVAVLNPENGQIERRIPTGRGAHNLFLSPDGKIIYATNRVDGTISLLDAKTLRVTRSFHVTGGPDDLDFAPDGKIWATLRFAHRVAVIDPQTGSYHTITVGRSPHGIWLNTHDRFPVQISARSPSE